MRQIDLHSRFKRDYKREKKANASLDAILSPVLKMLVTDDALFGCDHLQSLAACAMMLQNQDIRGRLS